MNFLPFARGGRSQGAASSASEGSRVASRAGSRALGAAAASFAMVAASLGPIASGAQAADARYYDGSSSERAAASCWEAKQNNCLLYTSPSPRDVEESRMPSSA